MYKKLYEQIWLDRREEDLEGAYYANCENCENRIYEIQLTVYNFAHQESKGASPEKKFDKNNIKIWCGQCHLEDHSSGEVNNYLPIK
jgi:hypothetical protein